MKILPLEIKPIVDALIQEDIRPVLVGGYLRDYYMKNPLSKDIDIELYNVKSLQQIIDILKTFATPHEVGKSFGVIKLSYKSYEFDFSLPRTESKVAEGHKGFEITTYQNISFKEAAKRRDFTINTLGYDLQTNTLLDPYAAIKDIDNKILTYVNKKSFTQDPLRLFRAVGFSARFELTCKSELIKLCQKMYENNSLTYLPKERVFDEIKKLFLRSKKPSIGLKLLQKMKSLEFFPQLYQLSKDSDTYENTLNMLDNLATKNIEDEKSKLQLMFVVLVLSFKSTQDVINFITSLNEDKKFLKNIISLYEAYKELDNFILSDYNIQKLALHVNIQNLHVIASLSTNIAIKDTIKSIYNRAKYLHVSSKAPQMILKGQNLIDLGMKPSKEFSTLLAAAFEAQLRGEFDNLQDALKWLKSKL